VTPCDAKPAITAKVDIIDTLEAYGTFCGTPHRRLRANLRDFTVTHRRVFGFRIADLWVISPGGQSNLLLIRHSYAPQHLVSTLFRVDSLPKFSGTEIEPHRHSCELQAELAGLRCKQVAAW